MAIRRYTTIPWMKGGKDNYSVDKIAVSVVYHSSIYDMRLRSTFKLMDKYKEIVCQVVSTLESELGIILTKEPVYKTILNRVKKVLLSHRAFRNKEKKITGGGEGFSRCA